MGSEEFIKSEPITYVDVKEDEPLVQRYNLTGMSNLECVLIGRGLRKVNFGSHLKKLGLNPPVKQFSNGDGNPMLIDLPLEYTMISRTHAIIQHWVSPKSLQEGYLLVDLGSQNGTKLNGAYIGSLKDDPKEKTRRTGHIGLRVLQDEDKITFGATYCLSLHFHDQRSPFEKIYGVEAIAEGILRMPSGFDYSLLLSRHKLDENDPVECTLLSYLQKNHQLLSELNPYNVLGVTPNSAEVVTKAAYRALMSRFHFDKLDDNQREHNGWRIVQTMLAQKVNTAYKMIQDWRKEK